MDGIPGSISDQIWHRRNSFSGRRSKKTALIEGGSERAALIRFRGGAHKAAAASQKPDLKADLRGYFGFFEQHAIEVGGV